LLGLAKRLRRSCYASELIRQQLLPQLGPISYLMIWIDVDVP
jgi:hypothetical protein